MRTSSFLLPACVALSIFSANALAKDVTISTRFGNLYHNEEGSLAFKKHALIHELALDDAHQVIQKFEMPDRDVLIIDQSINCSQTFHVVTVSKSGAWSSGDLGQCNPSPMEIGMKGQNLEIKLGKSLTYTYKPDGFVYLNGKKKADSRLN